jgi:hypothetical protein
VITKMDKLDIRCNGCNISLCLIKHHSTFIDKCPCATCLVKAMCKRICQPRWRSYVEVSKAINEGNNLNEESGS